MTAAPLHFFTLTGNLLAERTLELECWSPGRTQRARRETFQVGGKGINVSKMLTRLGVANTALCFTGGAPGAECEAWLREHRFSFRAFATTSPTRAGESRAWAYARWSARSWPSARGAVSPLSRPSLDAPTPLMTA